MPVPVMRGDQVIEPQVDGEVDGIAVVDLVAPRPVRPEHGHARGTCPFAMTSPDPPAGPGMCSQHCGSATTPTPMTTPPGPAIGVCPCTTPAASASGCSGSALRAAQHELPKPSGPEAFTGG